MTEKVKIHYELLRIIVSGEASDIRDNLDNLGLHRAERRQ